MLLAARRFSALAALVARIYAGYKLIQLSRGVARRPQPAARRPRAGRVGAGGGGAPLAARAPAARPPAALAARGGGGLAGVGEGEDRTRTPDMAGFRRTTPSGELGYFISPGA